MQAEPRSQAQQVRAMYAAMTGIENNIGGGEGVEGLYGSISGSHMQHMLQVMRDRCGLGSNSHLVDVGAGLGRPLIHALVTEGIRGATGIELDRIKCMKAEAFLRQSAAAFLKKGLVSALPRLPKMECKPIEQVKTLDPATHAYSFWEGVPVDARVAFGRLFAASRTLKSVTVVQRAMRKDCVEIMDKDYGFGPLTLVDSFRVTMSGSGRAFIAYVFNKTEPVQRLPHRRAARIAAAHPAAPAVVEVEERMPTPSKSGDNVVECDYTSESSVISIYRKTRSGGAANEAAEQEIASPQRNSPAKRGRPPKPRVSREQLFGRKPAAAATKSRKMNLAVATTAVAGGIAISSAAAGGAAAASPSKKPPVQSRQKRKAAEDEKEQSSQQQQQRNKMAKTAATITRKITSGAAKPAVEVQQPIFRSPTKRSTRSSGPAVLEEVEEMPTLLQTRQKLSSVAVAAASSPAKKGASSVAQQKTVVAALGARITRSAAPVGLSVVKDQQRKNAAAVKTKKLVGVTQAFKPPRSTKAASASSPMKSRASVSKGGPPTSPGKREARGLGIGGLEGHYWAVHGAETYAAGKLLDGSGYPNTRHASKELVQIS